MVFCSTYKVKAGVTLAFYSNCHQMIRVSLPVFHISLTYLKKGLLNTLTVIYLDAKCNSCFFGLSYIKCFQILPEGSRKCD